MPKIEELASTAPLEQEKSEEHPPTTRLESGVTRKNGLFGLTIFLGAFLLFQVQLLMGKYLLPWFGGTPSVWATCLLFFQLLLLGGYAYAHLIAARLPRGRQRAVHGSLLIGSLALLLVFAFRWISPITPSAGWRPLDASSPTILILAILAMSVGLPFLLLSTTGPLLQSWFARINPGKSPYRLYALSNLGSLLGVLTYPFLFEPNLTLHAQAWTWSAVYVVYAAACLLCSSRLTGADNDDGSAPRQIVTTKVGWAVRFAWLAWAACASALLLATTNVMCQQVAVIPFLWVLPLCLYLLSFILCFESDRWYRRGFFHLLYFVMAYEACAFLLRGGDTTLLLQLALYSALLFVCCMVCHGEVVRLKPSTEHLTEFYLSIAAGGALGGIFVSLIAPHIFSNFWEFPISLVATGVLLVIAVARDAQSWWRRGPKWVPWVAGSGVIILVAGIVDALGRESLQLRPVLIWAPAVLAMVTAVACGLVPRLRGTTVKPIQVAAIGTLAILAGGFLVGNWVRSENALMRSRNFYGVISVLHEESMIGPYLVLRDRTTNHGVQFLDPRLAKQAWLYYGSSSGIGILMRNYPRPMRVGLVGLGTGALTAYGQPGDSFRYYEINPAVVKVSSGPDAYFTYLRDSSSKVEVVLGDARLSLEQEARQGDLQHFDLLVLDAFSGDAIPTHLLTKEAFHLYAEHLRSPDSVIAVHISNLSLDLGPTVARLARELQFTAVRIYRPLHKDFSARTDWVLLSRNPASLAKPEIEAVGSRIPVSDDTALWTDDYSNLFRALK